MIQRLSSEAAMCSPGSTVVISTARVRWKIVPAVTDVRRPHALHIHWPLPVFRYSPLPQAGQMNPSGQCSYSTPASG
jgi:hypothetical protein